MKIILTTLAIACSLTSFAGPAADSSEFYFAKGLKEKMDKRYLVAAGFFDKAISFNKQNVQAYIENAYVNTQMRKLDAAKANFIKAYELQPTNAVVIKELTTLYFDYRQWDKAIELANKCTTCDNKESIIGMSNYHKENYMLAEKFLLQALAKTPNDARLNYTIARNYMEMEAYRKAPAYLEKAVALDPTKSGWAYELATLLYDNRNYAGAVAAYDAAIKNGIVRDNAFNQNYGYALLEAGNYEKGETLIMEIYAKKGNKEILRELAISLYNKKQYNRTLDYCQRLLQLDPKDGKALYQAGLAFIKMGDKNKGQGMCDKAIEMDPSLAGKKSSMGDMSGAL
jgi:tetratricopeptide (TPR) repeat protein